MFGQTWRAQSFVRATVVLPYIHFLQHRICVWVDSNGYKSRCHVVSSLFVTGLRLLFAVLLLTND
jgi:hypothetical protein